MMQMAGGDWRLRPTFRAMREIEARTQSSCATLLQLLSRMELHASEMAQICCLGLQEGGETQADPEAVGNRLFEAGITSDAVRTGVAEYLIALLYAPDDVRKKAAGEWWKEIARTTSLTFSVLPTASGGDPKTCGQPLPESSGQSSRPGVKPTSI